MALTKAKLMELIDNGDIDVGGGGFNPNLLHNWDFRNPINQRGSSGTISTDIYFYDRWKRAAANIVINSGYLALATNAELWQGIEGSGLRGETVTASVMLADGTICSGSGTFEDGSLTLTGFGTAVLDEVYDTDHSAISFKADAARNVSRVKLELGTVSTLHLDPPMDYGVELAKCHRYFIMLGTVVPFFGYTNSTTDASFSIPIPVTLRIATPSLYVSGDSFIFTPSGSAIAIASFYDVRSLQGILYFRATCSGGLTTWSSVNGYLAYIGMAYVSADL